MATKCLNKGILVQASGFRDNACNISIVLAPSSVFNHVPYIRIFLGFYKKIFFIFSNTGTLEHWNKLLILLHKLKKNTQNIQNISISTLLEHSDFKKCYISTLICVLKIEFYKVKSQLEGGFLKF
jgi:hypothetical protein